MTHSFPTRRSSDRFVDIREHAEVAKSGLVAGAVHVPRGLLEFQVDPESPTHNTKLAAGSRLVLYCGSGARSALAAKSLKDRSEEHTSELQSLMRISYAVICLKKKKNIKLTH